jgi:purine nucleosidase
VPLRNAKRTERIAQRRIGPILIFSDVPPIIFADEGSGGFDNERTGVPGRGAGCAKRTVGTREPAVVQPRVGKIATMQAGPPRTAPPPGVAFDASLDGDIDQPLALAMLFGLEGRRQVRVPSISTSRFSLQAARFLDLVARFYGGEQAGDFVVNRLPLPIGMATTGTQAAGSSPMLDAALTKAAADGKPVYPRPLSTLNETADPVALIRNALSAQGDSNAVVVLAGPPTNLLGVLSRPDGREWTQRKVRVLSIAGGRFADGPADPIIRRDVAGFRKLLAEWPSPIVMAGTELSEALPFPGASIESATAWAPHHPIVDAYRAVRPMPYDAPSRTLAAVLHAVSADQTYFDLSPPGTITMTDDGRTTFAASPAGRHRYLIAKPDQKERVLQVYVETVTAQPPPRPGRGPRPAA